MGGDLSTTAALGLAAQNLDTYAVGSNIVNTATAAMTLDMTLAAVTAFSLPNGTGAAPLLDGALAYDTTYEGVVVGSDGATHAVSCIPTVAACSADYSLTQVLALVTGCTMSLTAGSYLFSATGLLTGNSGDAVVLEIFNSTAATKITGAEGFIPAGTVLPINLSPYPITLGGTSTIILRAENISAARGLVKQLEPTDSAQATWLTALRYA